MQKWNVHTIANLFRFFIIVFVLLPSMMVVAVAFYEFKNTKQEKISHLQDIIDMQREVIDDWITNQSSDVRAIAELDFVRQGDKDSMNRNFTILLKNQEDISTIGYVNKDGIIEASNQPSIVINTNVTTRDYFQEAMLGKNYISDVLISKGTNQPMVVFSSPVRALTGEIKGVIYGVVRLTRINTFMEEFKFGQTGKMYLVSPHGRVIAGAYMRDEVHQIESISKISMIKAKFDNSNIAQALEGKSGYSLYEDYNGKKIVATYQQINRTKWAIIGEFDESEILKPFYRHLEFIATIYILALLFIIPIALLLYRKIIMPIQSLVNGSNAIEMGNYYHEIPYKIVIGAPKELQQLCEKFSQMSATIKDNIEVLYETNEILTEAETKYRILVENSLVGVYIIQDGVCTYVNPHFSSIFGYTQSEIMGIIKIKELVSPQDWSKVYNSMQSRIIGETENHDYEFRGMKKDGTIIELAVFGSVCNLKGQRAIIGTLIDISERKMMEEKLKHLSFHDQLTGLYNRNYFEEISARMVSEEYIIIGIIVCDLDGLKKVNDTLGHQQGDKLLKAAADVLRKCFNNSDIIARIGGDEFVVLLSGISSEQMKEAQQKIYRQIDLYNLEDNEINLSMSVGVTISSDMPIDINNLFNEADANMYQEKRRRREVNQNT